MLQTQTVSPELLELLKLLMTVPEISELRLVGGTSLALQMGHRISIDIDLFGKTELNELEITALLKNFGTATILSKSKNILIYTVNGVKIDFVNYSYNWIDEEIIIDNVRLASKKDIAAMKLNAIAGRGSKKDFIDLHFLLKEFSLKQMMTFYLAKYPEGSDFLVLKSLCYFEDADKEITPKILVPCDWNEIKTGIASEVSKYL